MSGTLLSDLDSSPSGSDDNAVQRILNEMNGGGPTMSQQQIQPPQLQSRQPSAPAQVMNAPNPNSTARHSMDNVPATAHMIGMEHPTNADFNAMMYQRPPPQQQWNMQPQQHQQQYPMMQPPNYYSSMKPWSFDIINELKTPILVALLFFVASLPVMNVMISHYLPSFVKGTGELTTFGLLLKSALAGGAFWILQRIVAPLLVSS
jgi:hypothetical protein